MGCTESTEKRPVHLVENANGSLTVFGDRYVVGGTNNNTAAANGTKPKPTANDKHDAKKKRNDAKSKGNTLVMKLHPHLFDCTGDDFAVVDVADNERELFKVDSNVLSINQRRVIIDAQTKKEVFVLREGFLQLGDDQTVCRPGKKGGDDVPLFKVCSGYGNMSQWTEDLKTIKGKPLKLVGKMNLLTMSGHIWVETGEPGSSRKAVAKIMSPLDWCDFWPEGWERDSFLVKVAPGVDYALILAMVLAYDKMNQTYDD